MTQNIQYFPDFQQLYFAQNDFESELKNIFDVNIFLLNLILES